MKNSEYFAFDVVSVPFPFSDLPGTTKKRPALVISSREHFGSQIGHSVLAMVTSAKHSVFPLDVPITDYSSAGLPKECIARMKLFTIDNRIIRKKVGTLSPKDTKAVKSALEKLFSWQ
jgi:mRNA interferase MazF